MEDNDVLASIPSRQGTFRQTRRYRQCLRDRQTVDKRILRVPRIEIINRENKKPIVAIVRVRRVELSDRYAVATRE